MTAPASTAATDLNKADAETIVNSSRVKNVPADSASRTIRPSIIRMKSALFDAFPNKERLFPVESREPAHGISASLSWLSNGHGI
jgi:hypothetical protein